MLQFIRGQLVAILMASKDPAALLITWAIYELARRPELIKELQAEIQEQYARSGSPPPPLRPLVGPNQRVVVSASTRFLNPSSSTASRNCRMSSRKPSECITPWASMCGKPAPTPLCPSAAARTGRCPSRSLRGNSCVRFFLFFLSLLGPSLPTTFTRRVQPKPRPPG